MADKKKKLAAALAAVSLYLQQEEAMAYEQQASLRQKKVQCSVRGGRVAVRK